MIGTVLRISWLNLLRDRVALSLTFLLPLVFFSVFAEVFSGLDQQRGQEIRIGLLVEEQTEITRRLEEHLAGQADLRLVPVSAPGVADDSHAILGDLVRKGRVDAALLVPTGFSSRLRIGSEEPPEVILIANQANPLSEPLVQGLLKSTILAMIMEEMPFFTGQGTSKKNPELVRIHVEKALSGERKKPSVAFFAAGIGVMFLLFSVSGRSAILIEERESGVLTRLRASRLTLNRLLIGRWLFLALLGFVQVSVMFVWAAVAFGLDLWTPRHMIGFGIMTAATASAASALGLLLAVSCRSRAQLNGIASVLILVMSALGGSMFPRFLMPENMQQIGRITFNAWALDGYQKVFWYEAKPQELWLECAVLVLACGVFLALAVKIARQSLRKKSG